MSGAEAMARNLQQDVASPAKVLMATSSRSSDALCLVEPLRPVQNHNGEQAPFPKPNQHTISTVRGALVYWASVPSTPDLECRVQIVDVVTSQIASRCAQDLSGGLQLITTPFGVSGRTWRLATAAQLIRHAAHPHRWVALQLHPHAADLFWQRGGLQRCRELMRKAQKHHTPTLPAFKSTRPDER